MVATGTGSTALAAQTAAYALARKMICANVRYRIDIGSRFIAEDQTVLRTWGYLTS